MESGREIGRRQNDSTRDVKCLGAYELYCVGGYSIWSAVPSQGTGRIADKLFCRQRKVRIADWSELPTSIIADW